MTTISVTRIHPTTGRVETPHLYPHGYFVLGDPRFGNDKKKAAFEVRVRTLKEVLELVRRGFHVRMHDGIRESRPSLISPGSLTVRVKGE